MFGLSHVVSSRFLRAIGKAERIAFPIVQSRSNYKKRGLGIAQPSFLCIENLLIPVIFLSLEVRIAEVPRVLEEHSKRLGQLVVLLDECLIIYFPQEEGSVFVLGRGWNEMRSRLGVEPLLIHQHLVPDVAAAAEGFFKQFLLGLVGVELDFEGGKPLDIRHIRPSSTSAFPVEEKEIVRSCVQPRPAVSGFLNRFYYYISAAFHQK